jgi:TolB-like protein/Tfp pilus assembly protein PilF
MASIIEGFSYDIFISYRQKDNKYDGWVSDFVENLKKELEATFKEEISVYFDINPHDGLLETHDVDASLKEKLKCLIFIPIISRTYCDPNSFAWVHEFKAIIKQASNDQYGLKVKVPGGNVGSRVLPVQIHDLEPEDKKLIENELRGFLRGIEFIYKSPGVNRPLREKEENPQNNLNHTIYRDQINKVANAVNEVITGLRHSDSREDLTASERASGQKELQDDDNEIRLKKRKIGIAVMLVLVLFVCALLVSRFIIKKNPLAEKKEKTIAVLPFTNRSNDTAQLWFCDGFVEDIRNDLQKVKSFTVRSKLSSDQFRDSKKSTIIIGNELNADYLVGGSVGREGDIIKIRVHLADAKADKQIWSNDYTREMKQLFSLQSEISKEIASELKTVLTPEEIRKIDKRPTENLDAYNLYLQGRDYWNKRNDEATKKSIECYNKALKIDQNYALAYSGLADVYFILVSNLKMPGSEGYPKAREYAMKAIELDKDNAEAHATLGTLYIWDEWKWEDARKELLYAIELNPNYSYGHYYYAHLLQVLGENEKARTEINIAMDLDPHIAVMRILSASYYFWEGKYREALDEIERVEEIDSPAFGLFMRFLIYSELNEDLKAFEVLQQMMRLDALKTEIFESVREIYNKSGITGIIKWTTTSGLNQTNNLFYLALLYRKLGDKEETLECLEKGIEEKIYDMPRINNAVQFDLIRNDPRFQALIKKMGLLEYQKVK